MTPTDWLFSDWVAKKLIFLLNFQSFKPSAVDEDEDIES